MKKIALDIKTESEMADLAGQIKALPRMAGGKIKSVPADLRKRVIRLVGHSGLSRQAVARGVGVTATTISGWQKGSTKKGKRSPRGATNRARSESGFKHIALKTDSLTSELPALSGLILELPNGVRVHGLSLEGLRELMSGGLTT